jgi:hypothetical protein
MTDDDLTSTIADKKRFDKDMERLRQARLQHERNAAQETTERATLAKLLAKYSA